MKKMAKAFGKFNQLQLNVFEMRPEGQITSAKPNSLFHKAIKGFLEKDSESQGE